MSFRSGHLVRSPPQSDVVVRRWCPAHHRHGRPGVPEQLVRLSRMLGAGRYHFPPLIVPSAPPHERSTRLGVCTFIRWYAPSGSLRRLLSASSCPRCRFYVLQSGAAGLPTGSPALPNAHCARTTRLRVEMGCRRTTQLQSTLQSDSERLLTGSRSRDLLVPDRVLRAQWRCCRPLGVV